ncbi:putative fimbrial-like protein [Klebsiella pneumoniae]|uniref:fimbrial protein n=1 Tax=Klebsiella TaxID=570 RepID=UPI0003BF4D67|nr:type 1 fimbrial protein [Klebsiella pneumoniae]AMA27758.1 fimbrial protein [Klebsiella pneumoniae subsp. pneumoniae]EIX9750959.1 type 1 fimbrial protein [Klebsiella pneumoniae]ELL9838731.1 type 1 fimbrial protein [Klebsiella pneumoniae]ELQ4792871.1 type 1 fimbrial protein [Klebsiella pneumoniae]ESL46781.1 hypothetical protein L461_03418 [Klebsiella pneumoniae BIDMC 25]
MKKIITLAPVALILGLASNVQAATQGDVTLRGTIVDTTCEITVNNGAAELNVGSFGKTAFNTAKKQVGQESLLVSLAQCTPEEQGSLLVTGIVGEDKEIFMSNTAQSAGFMLTAGDEQTQVENNKAISVTADVDGNLTYTFQAGMTVMDLTNIVPGEYNAPIKISYVNN